MVVHLKEETSTNARSTEAVMEPKELSARRRMVVHLDEETSTLKSLWNPKNCVH